MRALLSGPDRWNEQRTGLAQVAIEAKAHRLRPEALPLSTTLEGIFIIICDHRWFSLPISSFILFLTRQPYAARWRLRLED
jgi:hypothetical protein